MRWEKKEALTNTTYTYESDNFHSASIFQDFKNSLMIALNKNENYQQSIPPDAREKLKILAAEKGVYFQNKNQAEIFFEYVYQLNLLEFLISDCTGNRSLAGKIYLKIGIHSDYQEIILHVDHLKDIFTNQSLLKNLWIEFYQGIVRAVSYTHLTLPTN